jgi:hypothetical protein
MQARFSPKRREISKSQRNTFFEQMRPFSELGRWTSEKEIGLRQRSSEMPEELEGLPGTGPTGADELDAASFNGPDLSLAD